MATSKGSNPLESWYENSIGSPSTVDEVYGYWVFVLGIVAGFLGIALVLASNSPGGTIRGVGIALAALGLLLLLTGPIIRLPLEANAKKLSYIGAAIGVLAVAWFAIEFNAGNWGAAFTNNESLIIGLYGLGILVIATGSVVTPLVRRPHSGQQAAEEQEAAETRAGQAEAKRDAAMREIDRQEEHDEQTASEAEHQALVTEVRRIKESQSQFELYTDQGGKYRWRLRHDNDNIIADSAQGYASRQGAQQGLNAVKRDAFGAAVLDLDKMDTESEDGDDSQPEDDVGSDDPPAVTEQDGTQATFETYEDRGGKYRWRLRHDNDNIIADSSQGYASKASRDDGLEMIRHYVQSADYLHIDPAAFELYRDEGGEYRWRLLHENGNILADSGQGYASESSAHDAVDRIREYAPEAHVLDIGSATFEIYEDEGGSWRWRLRHRNGNIMADGSQGYASRIGAEDGINSVKQNAPEAEVEAVGS